MYMIINISIMDNLGEVLEYLHNPTFAIVLGGIFPHHVIAQTSNTTQDIALVVTFIVVSVPLVSSITQNLITPFSVPFGSNVIASSMSMIGIPSVTLTSTPLS